MVDTLQIVGAVAGFGPAMFLLYYTLRRYTYPKAEKPFFDDRRVFMFFALGVVLGMIIFAFESWGMTIGSAETVLVLIIGFAAMEELLKLVILNYPKFQRKVDTAFYGVSLGLGIASTFTFAAVYVFLLELSDPTATDAVAVMLLGVLFVLLHGSTTAIIGIGVARGDVKGYFPEALLIHVVFSLLYESFFVVELFTPPANLIGLVGSTALVVYAYQKVHRQSLPAIIRDAKRLAQKKKP
jgi:hypothetical protein